MTERIVIVGGPRCGKSTLARELAGPARIFCGDPLSKVKEPRLLVNYLPEGLGFDSESSQWIVDHWLPMPGPWVLEGHVMARVLRKWLKTAPLGEIDLSRFPCDRVIVFLEQRPELELLKGQVSLHKAVMTEWSEIADYYEPITSYAGHESSFHGSGGVD